MLNPRRGKNLAVAGAAFQAVLAGVLLVIWLWTGSRAAMSVTWMLAGGIVLWLVVALLFYCRLLAAREQRELEELAGAATAGSVFEGEKDEQVRPAAARVAWMDRWVVPIFTLLWALCQGAMAAMVLRYLRAHPAAAVHNPLEGVLFLVLVCLSGFLFGRYALGMSSVADWRLLRATGSYLLVNVLLAAGAAAGLVAALYQAGGVDRVVAYIVPVVQALLALELVLNFILDLYRPRVPGREQRPSFDSRLLNLLADPGKVGHSIAETLNYQFGFEVSKTWFYRLLQRALAPLILAGAVVLMGMSSIVIVNEGEVYVVKHWGRLSPSRPVLGPGIHLKWPWPVDSAERFYTGRPQEVMIGAGEKRTPEEIQASMVNGKEIYLWGEEHGVRKELDFLVAIPPRAGEGAELLKKAPPVNIIKLVVGLYYAVEDPYKFGYQFVDAGKLLEGVANREMANYCASATLTEPIAGNTGDRPEAIMTLGGSAAAQRLRDRIQKRCDDLDLGVRITHLEILALHPPKDVAREYERVLEAERGQDASRYVAQGDAYEMLAKAAGDPAGALSLAQSLKMRQDLEVLQGLAGTKNFAPRLEEYMNRVTERLSALKEEAARQKATGTTGEEGPAQLAAKYARQLATYQEIRKDPGGFDFDKAQAEAMKQADDEFRTAAGESVKIVARAIAERWSKELTERGRAEAFQQQQLAYQANKQAYMEDLLQEAWEQVLPGLIKYVLGVDRNKVEIRLDVQRKPGEMVDLRGRDSTGK